MMKKFEVGQEVWIVDQRDARVLDATISDQFAMDGFCMAKVTHGRSFSYKLDTVFATAPEAHAEAVRRAHSIVNRAELARARAMPEDKTQTYWVYDSEPYPRKVFASYVTAGDYFWQVGKEAFPTPAEAIIAVIPECDRG